MITKEQVIERINAIDISDDSCTSEVTKIVKEYMFEYGYRDEFTVKIRNGRVTFCLERNRRDLNLLDFLNKYPVRSKTAIEKSHIKKEFSFVEKPYAQPKYSEIIHSTNSSISLSNHADIPKHMKEKNTKRFIPKKGI